MSCVGFMTSVVALHAQFLRMQLINSLRLSSLTHSAIGRNLDTRWITEPVHKHSEMCGLPSAGCKSLATLDRTTNSTTLLVVFTVQTGKGNTLQLYHLKRTMFVKFRSSTKFRVAERKAKSSKYLLRLKVSIRLKLKRRIRYFQSIMTNSEHPRSKQEGGMGK